MAATLSLLSLSQLRCEYLVNPLGIDRTRPRLGWILQAVDPERRGLRQVAYQILVASSEDLLAAGSGDLWDSGKIASAQSTHVPYAGQPLTSGQRCWWKVRAWDNSEGVSEYSEPAWWEMGLLDDTDWQGQWIGLKDLATISRELDEIDREVLAQRLGLLASPYLRKGATLPHTVRRARLYTTAKGVYEIHINGQRVGDALLAPGWTDYYKRIQYQTYDVTEHLRQGENVIGAILGSGWYCGHVGFLADDVGYKYYGQEPRLLLQLHIEYADGTSEMIASDETWQGTFGPIVYSDFLAGETYDARYELPGWDEAISGIGSTAIWQPVLVEPRNETPRLVADCAEPVRITETLHPQGVTEVSPGVHIYDMGQNMVGWVRLRVQGEPGTRVQLRFVEMLNPDGTIYTINLRSARQTDSYILKGDGQETFEPHFTFHGFRYVEVTGYPGQPTLDTITGYMIQSATPPAGTFECSSPMVNQLQRNIVWGQRGNFLSVPTDCPQRDERLGWMGDAQIFIRTACYNMHVAAFFNKWMNDVVDAQSANGAFPDVAPRLVVKTDGAPAWGDAGVIIPWTIYQMYGDTAFIEQHYDAMTRWLDYLQRANPDLLWTNLLNNNYGDWLSIAADTPKEVMATAYFAYDALLLSRMARVIGRYDEAEKYHALHKNISAAFCKAYVSPDGKITGDTQTCYVLALHMQLLPAELRLLAAQRLVADIEKKGWHLSTGFVGVGYLCPVLTDNGYVDVAYRLLNNDTFPSWGYSIKHGATTIWERWDGWTEEHGFQDPGMNSFNHYSLGSVGQWLFQDVAGINLDMEHPGFERALIRPYPGGGLTYVRATYQSIHGSISSHWQLDEHNNLTLHVSIPANTTALVSIPAVSQEHVFEGGTPAEQAAGVKFLYKEEGRVVYEVGSGTYQFAVR